MGLQGLHVALQGGDASLHRFHAVLQPVNVGFRGLHVALQFAEVRLHGLHAFLERGDVGLGHLDVGLQRRDLRVADLQALLQVVDILGEVVMLALDGAELGLVVGERVVVFRDGFVVFVHVFLRAAAAEGARERACRNEGEAAAAVEKLAEFVGAFGFEILMYGKFEPIISVERDMTSIPVPEKVFEDMRECAAGIIHVMSEGTLKDAEGREVTRINENVLIEIGAAIALYRKKFILLVQKGVKLPSNLQGLYRCEYEGDKLDYEATMKLLKTFNQFRENA